MLKQRVLTAVVLAPLVLLGILYLETSVFAAIIAIIVALGAWEWAVLARLQGVLRVSYVVIFLLSIAGLYYYLIVPAVITSPSITLLYSALIWWGLALAFVIIYPYGSRTLQSYRLLVAAAGYIVLLPAWASIVLLLQHSGPGYVLLLMLLVWGADIGAYFSGRRFGRYKLAPRVSPGKTWEGLVGALVASVIIVVIAFPLLEVAPESRVKFLALSLLVVLVSVLGDLLESMFKRMADVKDSGGLLPGHGGILDRIDSLTAAAPVFALGLYMLGVME